MLCGFLGKFPHEVARMPARDRDELLAFFELHPMPDAHWDAGMIAATIANVNRSKGGRTFHPGDFMPRAAVKGEKQSTEEMLAVMNLIGKEE